MALLEARTAGGRPALQEAEHWARRACVQLLKAYADTSRDCFLQQFAGQARR